MSHPLVVFGTECELKKDALVLGLFKKIKTAKFLGTLYILKEVLPCLSTLSRTFQTDALNVSHMEPAIQCAQASLESLESSGCPLKKFEDVKPGGRLESLGMAVTDNDKNVLRCASM